MELITGNSYSRVTGLTTSQFAELRKLLSYQTDKASAYFSGGYVRTKYLIDSKGNFPTGLLSKVENFLLERHDTIHYDNRMTIPKAVCIPYALLPHRLYKAQERAVSEAIHNGRGCISMPTGTGKSLVIAQIIAKLMVKTLIVVPTLEIKNQLRDMLRNVFGNMDHIAVENIGSPKLKNMKDFDCLIIDEAHHVAAKTYQKLNKTAWTGIYYRFFLTATPFRNKTEEQLLFESIAGQVIYQLSYKEAIKDGYIVPVEAYYIDLPKQKVSGYTWAQVYNELVVNNKPRNETIANLMWQFSFADRSTLCLVKEIKHGRILAKLANRDFVCGEDQQSRAIIGSLNNGMNRSVVGTTGVLGEGVDTKPVEYVIIAGLGKAKSAFMQQIGRAVRKYSGKESAKIILFRDASHKFTLRHFNAQKKILLEEYGVKVQKLKL